MLLPPTGAVSETTRRLSLGHGGRTPCDR